MSWRYETAEGETAFYVVRWNEGDKKVIRPLSWFDGDGWKFAAWPNNRPLYNLPAIAEQPNAPIVVCEGEKAADPAARIFPKSIATTSSGGAGAQTKSDWSPLARRPVLIWPDNDPPGEKYAGEAATLTMFDCSILILDAKTLAAINPGGGSRDPKAKWDAADAIAEWPDLDALRKGAFACAKPFEPGPRYQSWGSFTMTAKGLEVETEGRGKERKTVRERVSGPFEILRKSHNPKGGDWGLMLRWRDGDVQPVNVAEEGQAIVGNVNAPSPGGGASEKSGEQPQALGYAQGVEMPREVKAERVAVPSAGG